VERDVVVGDRLRDFAFEVAHQPRRRGLQPRRDRVHEELDWIGPAHDAAQQSELVAAHRRGGPCHDHGTTVGRHGEQLLVLLGGCDRGDHELGESGSHGQFEPRRDGGRAADVLDDEPAERPFARDDAARLQGDVDAVLHAPEDEGHRDEHGGREGRPQERELDPAESPRERERHDDGAEHEPSGRRDDPGDGRRERGDPLRARGEP